MQENIMIGEIVVPTIKEGGEIWYPISFINKNFLERQKVSSAELKKYIQYVCKKTIDYTYLNDVTNIQEVNCITHDGLIEWIKNKNIGTMNLVQKKKFNWIREYLGLDAILEKSRFCYGFDKIKLYNHPEIDQMILSDYFEKNKDNQKLQLCSRCGNYLPYSSQFFNGTEIRGLSSICVKCDHNNNRKNYSVTGTKYKEIYDVFGEDGYNLYVRSYDDKNMKIYRHYVENYDTYIQNKITPSVICHKIIAMSIINKMYENGEIGLDQLQLGVLREKYKFDFVNDITVKEIHQRIFGKDCIYYIWKYPCLRLDLKDMTFNEAKLIYNNYINENNIKIKNPLNYDYFSLFSKCGIRGYVDKYEVLSFIRDLHDGEYGAYEFKYSAKNHWDDKENRIIALKHLINNYIINRDDVPLMLSIRYLRDISHGLYRVYRKYYNSIFEWVNECYPNYFTEKDFGTDVIKGNFESIEEKQVDYIMRKILVNAENLIHNDQKFNIKGLKPDWLYIDEKPYIIEYYGLYDKKKTESIIVNDYVKRHDSKTKVYDTLENYNVISIYLDDLKKNYEGLKNKIKILNDCTL